MNKEVGIINRSIFTEAAEYEAGAKVSKARSKLIYETELIKNHFWLQIEIQTIIPRHIQIHLKTFIQMQPQHIGNKI